MRDNYGREIDYLRISITDRCNLRCVYCMPEEGIEALPMSEILTYEQIATICQAAAGIGIKKIRITGGEPLVRADVEKLVAMIKAIDGIEQVCITTNGILLSEKMDALVAAGLDAVNISLDTTDREEFAKITRRDMLDKVLKGIEVAVLSGITVKVNTVLHDHEIYKSVLELAKDKPIDVRFIELMPIGQGRKLSGASNSEVLDYLKNVHGDIEPDTAVHGNGPAVYYKLPGFKGSIGFISPMHGIFCDKCNRLRLSATGEIKPCLCYGKSFNIKEALESGSIDEITKMLVKGIEEKPQMHCFDKPSEVTEEKKMVSIGG